jgi:cupin superfamily acireductone dioxygenase involved in methionine salvage
MEVLPFKLPKSEKDALIHQEDTGIAFFEQLHQHEEMQISYIVKGSGTLIVGDSVSIFNENDILVIGENLPHVFEVAKHLLIKVGRGEKLIFPFT